MGWKVVFSLQSQRDLERIVAYIARDNRDAAEAFGIALIDYAENIAKTPEMGPILPARPGCRYLPFGMYLIIYRAEISREEIRILRIWHGARGKRPLR